MTDLYKDWNEKTSICIARQTASIRTTIGATPLSLMLVWKQVYLSK